MEPLLISKSHAETLWHCPRAEYLGYYWGDTGLRGTAPAFDYDFGIAIHDALAKIAQTTGQSVDIIKELAPVVQQQVYDVCIRCQMDHETAMQWAAIGEGLIRAFYRRIWPQLMREYEVAFVEQPCAISLGDDLWFIARNDLVLKHRITGGYWYIEYKTTGWLDAKWINSWSKAVQVHGGMKAAEQTLGITFDGCIVLGLYKGRKDYYNHIQNSPFSYGFVNRGVPGVLTDQYSYTSLRGKGWERFPTWSLVDGLGPWVEAMPSDLIDAQFVRTPPISMQDDLVEDFFAQLSDHAGQVREAQRQLRETIETPADIKRVLNHFFPQSFKNCTPSFGSACGFNDICWSSAIGRDPVGSGSYRRRTIEHQAEFMKLIIPGKEAA